MKVQCLKELSVLKLLEKVIWVVIGDRCKTQEKSNKVFIEAAWE